MVREQSGSTALAVATGICLIIAITLLLNCIATRTSFDVDSMKENITSEEMKEQVASKLDTVSSVSDKRREEIMNIMDSPEFESVMDQYTEYLSDYFLESDDSKAITEQQLSELMLPYVQEKYPDAETEQLEEQVNQLLEETQMERVFSSADRYIPARLAGIIQSVMSKKMRNIMIAVVLLSILAMYPCATRKRYLFFLGISTILAGGMAYLSAKVAKTVLPEMTSLSMLDDFLVDYAKVMQTGSFLVIGIGIAILVGGIAYSIYRWRKNSIA